MPPNASKPRALSRKKLDILRRADVIHLVETRKEDAARLEAKLRARLQEAGAKLPVASSSYKPGEEPATRKGGGKGGKGGKKGA